MKDSARRYHCVYCQTPVVICRACDRGNIYCFNGCSELKRTESQRAANRRHQSTPRGMRLHAARQQRYRQRQRENEKVTDQGSPPAPSDDVLPPELERRQEAGESTAVPSHQTLQCHDCGRYCSPFVRLTVLGGRFPRGGPVPHGLSY